MKKAYKYWRSPLGHPLFNAVSYENILTFVQYIMQPVLWLNPEKMKRNWGKSLEKENWTDKQLVYHLSSTLYALHSPRTLRTFPRIALTSTAQ